MPTTDLFQKQVIAEIVRLAIEQHVSMNLSYRNFKRLLGLALKNCSKDNARIAYLCNASVYEKVLNKLRKEKPFLETEMGPEKTAAFVGIDIYDLMAGASAHVIELNIPESSL